MIGEKGASSIVKRGRNVEGERGKRSNPLALTAVAGGPSTPTTWGKKTLTEKQGPSRLHKNLCEGRRGGEPMQEKKVYSPRRLQDVREKKGFGNEEGGGGPRREEKAVRRGVRQPFPIWKRTQIFKRDHFFLEGTKKTILFPLSARKSC